MTRWMSEKLSPKSLCSFWYNLLTLNHKLNIWQTKFLSLQRESHLQRRTMLNSPKGLDRVKESSLAIWIMLTVYGYMNEWLYTHVRSYVGCMSSSKRWKLISVYALRCFDDLTKVQGPGPMQSMKLVQASKCWTTVKVVCVRKFGERAEYFINQGRLVFLFGG